MRRIALVTFLFFCALCTLVGARTAWAYTPPANDGPITDPAHRLTPEQKAQLDAKLRAYRDRTTNEITYFIAASLEGENRDDVAYTTFHTWHLGQAGKDNGILVLFAPSERQVRIEVGKGLEGDLTDIQSNDIVQKTVKPHLQRDDFFGAVDESSTAIIGVLGDTGVASKPRVVKRESSGWTFLLLFVGFALFWFYMYKRVIKDARERARRRALGLETDADLLTFTDVGSSSSFSDDSGRSSDSGGGDWGGGGDTGGGGAGDSY